MTSADARTVVVPSAFLANPPPPDPVAPPPATAERRAELMRELRRLEHEAHTLEAALRTCALDTEQAAKVASGIEYARHGHTVIANVLHLLRTGGR